MHVTRRTTIWALALGLAAPLAWPAVPGRGPAAARLRRPVALALLADGHTLAVANRGGSLSLVELRLPQVTGEVPLGGRLSGLAALPDGKRLLVTDEERHELIALDYGGDTLRPRERLQVSPYPASVAVLPDGRRATVASTWSRRVEVVEVAPLRVRHTVRLPFAPGQQLALPGGAQVLVADAFGGHLAVVDAEAGRLVAVHELNGHNLRGLALAPGGKDVLLAHQVLDQKAPTTRANIERGLLMTNVLRSLPLEQLRTPGADLERAGRVVRLGGVGAGAGDPAGVAVLDGGEVAVALAGVDEVALLRPGGDSVRRVRVGRRPTALLSAAPGRLVVANTFGDSLTLLDARRGTVAATVALGPTPALEAKDRGELLFHDARLARDGWLSCHSCHSDGHSNGLLADTLGDGTYGTPKRTLTLRGTALTDPWAWNGSFKYLGDQVRQSLAETMHAPAVSAEQVEDLTSFLHSLPPPPPLEPPGDAADREQVERGRRVFEARGCARCHVPPLTYSSPGTQDVGFADERGRRQFNPPSLRGVGQGYRFLHDNRAASLEEVFTRSRHKTAGIADDDLGDLLRFLRSL
jgi:cytochrome c peroxidase